MDVDVEPARLQRLDNLRGAQASGIGERPDHRTVRQFRRCIQIKKNLRALPRIRRAMNVAAGLGRGQIGVIEPDDGGFFIAAQLQRRIPGRGRQGAVFRPQRSQKGCFGIDGRFQRRIRRPRVRSRGFEDPRRQQNAFGGFGKWLAFSGKSVDRRSIDEAKRRWNEHFDDFNG